MLRTLHNPSINNTRGSPPIPDEKKICGCHSYPFEDGTPGLGTNYVEFGWFVAGLQSYSKRVQNALGLGTEEIRAEPMRLLVLSIAFS